MTWDAVEGVVAAASENAAEVEYHAASALGVLAASMVGLHLSKEVAHRVRSSPLAAAPIAVAAPMQKQDEDSGTAILAVRYVQPSLLT